MIAGGRSAVLYILYLYNIVYTATTIRLHTACKYIAGKWMMSTAFSVSTLFNAAAESCWRAAIYEMLFFFVRALLVLNVLLALFASLKLSIK